ncbi:hypothetical protein SBOR_9296 [Sclerotinia borealis F-4128]|uniref:Uncharacterized protein n=1 Tax=Sclerotinia borealis (strain F-4128) TaxID=1432307 RepID=W9C386_SCLBF|nr:hypothetical protein SBOR_9296 [Sclerotinia borealis F-4128]
MSTKRNLSLGVEDRRKIKHGKTDPAQPSTRPTKQLLPASILQPGDNGPTIGNASQESGRNVIIMKNNLGENMEMSLDFGPMRKGPPSTDDEESEEESEENSEKKPEDVSQKDATITKKAVKRIRYSQMKGSDFLSKGVIHPKEEEVKPKFTATQTKETATPKKFGRRKGGDFVKKTLRP